MVDACLALIRAPGLSLDDLMAIVPGPDFPTGGIILGRIGIRGAYQIGRGSIVMRGKVEIETIRKEREAIIITEIPYQVNKAAMVEKIGELVREKKLEGIAELRDESDRDGYRVVIELKRDAMPDVVLNQLYRFTPLQSTFGANMVALDGGRPQVMTLKDMLQAFIAFREEVVSRRAKHLLGKARDRAHILVGLAIAVANIDEVIRIIRAATDPNSARDALMSRDWPAATAKALFDLIDDPRHRLAPDGTARLSIEQAKAILDLRLQRLTALGRDEIAAELDKLAEEIADYLEILRSRARIQAIIKDELEELKRKFATPRRTVILDQEGEMEDEDLIQREDMVVTVSHHGYVKRVPLSTYRAQKRGGKGRAGMQTREEDFVARLFVASTHTPVLFFSSHGRVYQEKVWRMPLAAPQARGKALINILPLEPGERITTIMPLPEDESKWAGLQLMFATTNGIVRKIALDHYIEVRPSGIKAIKLEEDDSIASVELCKDDDDILLTTREGQCIRFPTNKTSLKKGRDTIGDIGIKLDGEDKVISMSILRHVEATAEERMAYLKRAHAVRRGTNGEAEENGTDQEEAEGAIELGQERYAELSAKEQFVLTISEKGYGKRTWSYEYRTTGRGGKGIVAMAVTEKTGRIVASFPIEDSDQIMLVTDGGQLIRCPVDGIRIAGRGTQGVIVFDTAEGERVVSVERLSEENGEE